MQQPTQTNTALVTGGSRGIGRAIALRLAQNGMNVAILYSGDSQAAAGTVEELQALQVQAQAYRCDVSDFEQTREVVDRIVARFGGIDVLVNNAGILRDGLLLSMSEEDFARVVDTNLKGAFHLIRHTYRHFMRKRRGRIINITSVSGISGNAGQANYAAAKAGMIGLTKSVARELAGRGVTCNAIAPGFIHTDMTAALPEKVRASATAAIPMGRMGDPREVAEVAAFLAGEQAGYITGEVIRVDGGLCM